ncbi:hypothetical protein QIS99_09945 [Streptomyces sp. B-S-A8]|uniref:Uncharacterized protein n=1 Tax=Streptomyces solicavernae TaxID=3043614 RepID=A0ABT6RS93_9ACTN|nr:hypothetical protein [Streptomyces sp. B-S-A8]MDI3386531.1 hypothetical protein [Streptomyces sp. B-S-A8]
MPTPAPAIGTLLLDLVCDQLGEFRGELGNRWFLRPACGGTEWEVAPERTRPATVEQRLRVATARANARSRGELL